MGLKRVNSLSPFFGPMLPFFGVIGQGYILETGQVSRFWTASKDGNLSYCFHALSSISASTSPLHYFWKAKFLPRVIAFGRLALCGSILTMDNLGASRSQLVQM